MNLYNMPSDTVCSVRSIPESDLLKSLGVIPGATIRKLSSYRGGGPAMICLGDRHIAIGKKIAEKVIIGNCDYAE